MLDIKLGVGRHGILLVSLGRNVAGKQKYKLFPRHLSSSLASFPLHLWNASPMVY